MNQRRLVIHVTLSLDMGGQEQLLAEFARHADRRRFALHFVALGERGRLAAPLEELGCPVTSLEEPAGLRPALVMRLAKLFHELEADVIHTHDDKPLLYGAPAARLARVRHIHTHHHGRLPQFTRRQEKLVALAARLPHRVACVSQDCAGWLGELGVPAKRLLTVHNGIDRERFAFHGPHPSGPAVCVARLSPEKDLANLLHAAAQVAEAVPDFRLEIAGDGPLREDLLQLRQPLGLSERVAFLGVVRDISAVLRRARLFVLPSQSEGISLTLLEAMASGLPVVATRVGGNPEVVEEGSTGLLVPPGDPRALAQAMLKLWHNPERGRTLGQAGRHRVEKHFDIRAMVGRYEALYGPHHSPLTTRCMS